MITRNKLGKFHFGENKFFFGLYALFFGVMLCRIIVGVGQYWDWVFPYYGDQIGNFFNSASQSWTRNSQGSPLIYSTDYFFRFFVSLIRIPKPEWLFYTLLVLMFTSGAYGIYLIAKQHIKKWLAFLVGLVAFVNPIIFYNYTAGYIDYIFGFVFFIYLVYFLLYKYRPSLRHAVIVGLLLLGVGVAIQLFILAGIFICIFFCFRPSTWRIRDILVILTIPILGSLVWLSNFISGGSSLSGISSLADQHSFSTLISAEYFDIFSFSFSRATLIWRFYNSFQLTLYGLFFTVVLLAIIRSKKKTPEDVGLVIFMVVMIFFTTGIFRAIELGPLSILYPMYREVGHFAPLILLAMVLLLSRLFPKGILRYVIIAWMILIVVIGFNKFQSNSQAINFGKVRQQFSTFKQFSDTHTNNNQRILTYPFFDQYAFTKFPIKLQDNLPLQNAGHDSFAMFNNQNFINNAVPPQDFKSSLQYQLLTTHNVDVLKPYNVKYLYDFSNIYESYYNRYVPSVTYDNDPSVIKNDPNFFGTLLKANPGKLKRVSSHILEIINDSAKAEVTNNVFQVASSSDGQIAQNFMELIAPNNSYHDVINNQATSDNITGSITPLFSTISKSSVDGKNKSLNQSVQQPSKATSVSLFSVNKPNQLNYVSKSGILTFYISGSGKLYQNNNLIQDNDNENVSEIGKFSLVPSRQYYADLDGKIVSIDLNGSGAVGNLFKSSNLALYQVNGDNKITDPSFETGLWKKKVTDCYASDSNSKIGMKLDTSTASVGKNSLELYANTHNACTSTSFTLKGSSDYLLNYDYQSPNAQSADFYLELNHSTKDSVRQSQIIADQNWHTSTEIIKTPNYASSGELFVHAAGSNDERPTINRYDNFKLLELQEVGSIKIPSISPHITQFTLQNQKSLNFQFIDSSYAYTNLIENGSFEKGIWQKQVTDCANRDIFPKISAIVGNDSSDGKHSLQLESTRHTACEYTNVKVNAGSDYLLAFDYKGDSAQKAGYYMQFSSADGGRRVEIPISDKSWHTYSETIHIPPRTDVVRLYLHAYQSDAITNNVVRFDNVKLIALPRVENQFYVVSATKTKLQTPENLSYKQIDETRRDIGILGSKGPFILTLGESYHPGWRLELENNKTSGTNSWWPGAKVNAVKNHFLIDNYANAWYVNPADLCAQASSGCSKQSDGSYNFKLIAEFVPQRAFVISRVISVTTLIIAGSYLLVSWRISNLNDYTNKYVLRRKQHKR